MKTIVRLRKSAVLPIALLLTVTLMCCVCGMCFTPNTAFAADPPNTAIELIDATTGITGQTPSSGKYTFGKGSNKDSDSFCYPFHNARLDNDRYYKADATQINDYYASKNLNAQIKFKWDIVALEATTGYSEFGGIIGAFGDKYLTVSLYGYAYGSDSFSQVVPVFGTASKGDASVVEKIDGSINWTSPGDNASLFAVGNTIEFTVDKSPSAVTATMKIVKESETLTRTITLDAAKISGLDNVADLSLAFGAAKRATGGEFYDYSCKVWHDTEALAGECTEHRASTDFMYSDATHWNVCTVCGETMNKAAHRLTETVTVEPTRDAAGKKTVACETCGYRDENVIIPKVRDEFTAGNTTYGGATKQLDGSFVFEREDKARSFPFANVAFDNDLYFTAADTPIKTDSKSLTAHISFTWEIGDFKDNGGARIGAAVGAIGNKRLRLLFWGLSDERAYLCFTLGASNQSGDVLLDQNWTKGKTDKKYFATGNKLLFDVTKSSTDITAKVIVTNGLGEKLTEVSTSLKECYDGKSSTDTNWSAVTDIADIPLAFGPFLMDAGGTFYDYSVTFDDDIRADYVCVDGTKLSVSGARAGETATIDFANAVLAGPTATAASGYKVEAKIGEGSWTTVNAATNKTSATYDIGESVAANTELSIRVTPITAGTLAVGGEKTVQVGALLPRLDTPANVRVDSDTLRYGRAPTVRWDAVANATRYTLECKRGDGEWEVLYEGEKTFYAAVATLDSMDAATFRVTASETVANRTHRNSLPGATETLTVGKGLYPRPTLTAVAEASKITVDPIGGCEYRLNDGAWQDSNVFEGLTVNTEYTVSIRYKGSDTMEVGETVSAKFTTRAISEPNIPMNGRLNGFAIAGIVVGCVVGAGLIAFAVVFFLRKKKKSVKK